MGWDFEDVGNFRSREDAERWAKANNIEPRDLDVRSNGGRGVSASVRRTALTDGTEQDRSYGRTDGFY